MRKILTILVAFALMGLSAATKAQIPTLEWGRTGVCSLGEIAVGWYSASDLFGNVYMTGASENFQPFDTMSFGQYHLLGSDTSNFAYVVKYDHSGNVIWARASSGAAEVGITLCITTDVSGNVYLVGEYSGASITFGSFTLTNAGSFDIFIVKYDSSGTVLWAKNIGSTGEDDGTGITTDALGNIFITGYYHSPTLTFGTHTITNLGQYNIFVAKYDSMGNAIWAKNAGGTIGDQGNAIAADSSGNIYVTGSIASHIAHFNTITITNNVNINFFLAKYDTYGNIIWVKNSTGYGEPSGASVATNIHGFIYSTGGYNGLAILGNDTLYSSTQGINVFIVKYDTSGNLIWARNSLGAGHCIISDSSDNAYVCGYMVTYQDSTLFDTITLRLPIIHTDAMFIVKYNSSGHALYGFALPSGGENQSVLSFGLNGSIYVSGDYATENFIFENDTLVITGGDSASFNNPEEQFLLKLSLPFTTEVIENDQPNNSLSLYPNPTTSLLTISLPNTTQKATINLYDMLGEKVLETYTTYSTQSTIDLSTLPPGIYFLEVLMDGEKVVRKVVKM